MKRTKKDLIQSITKDYTSAKLYGNNTLIVAYADGTSAVRFHDTDVVTFSADESTATLNTGGFRTNTTKERINGTLRAFGFCAYIFQKKYVWYIADGVQFVNGMQIKRKV